MTNQWFVTLRYLGNPCGPPVHSRCVEPFALLLDSIPVIALTSANSPRRGNAGFRRVAAASLLVAAAVGLSACQDMPNTSMDDQVGQMGNAQPADSPAATKPAGKKTAFDAVLDAEASGDTFLVRTAKEIHVGTASAFADGKAATMTLPEDCGDITPGTDGFVAACGDKVLLIPAGDATSGTTLAATEVAVTEEFPVTAAAQLSTGEIFVGSNAAPEVAVYKDGQRIDALTVAAPTDQLVAVRNQDESDNVVRVWRADTTIQNLDWEKSREGGRLRVGTGVGLISSGNHGVVVAADTKGERVAIYTAEDVVRLHQFGNVEGTPWATAWDPAGQLAWVTTTDNNKVHGYHIASGVPELQATLGTVAGGQHLAAADDGTLLVGSATGDGIQLIAPADVDAAQK